MSNLFSPGVPFPINVFEAKAYTVELAQGLHYWAMLDVFILVIAILTLAFTRNATILKWTLVIAIGCPAIMTLEPV
jgi:hypothetical protein